MCCAVMGLLYDMFRMGLDAIEVRIPFKIIANIRGNPPTIFVSIVNRTKATALFVSSVRIHFGQRDYTYAFMLYPFETQEIKPGNTKDFSIDFTKPKMQRRLIVAMPLPGH